MPTRMLDVRPGFRLQIKHGVALGPGKAELLERIVACGSITQAAKAMGMGYRTAWMLVDSMNHQFIAPLVVGTRGGARGGGAELTALGRDVLARYRAMERRALEAIAQDVASLEALIKA